MASSWWKKLSRKEQLLYLKAHPRSKLKPKPATKRLSKATKVARKTARSSKAAESTSSPAKTEQQVKSVSPDAGPPLPKPEPLTGAHRKDAENYVDANADAIGKMLDTKVKDEIDNIPNIVDSMSPKEMSQVGRLIRDSSGPKRKSSILRAAGSMLLKAGILTVGLSVATTFGIPPTVYLLGLWSYKDDIKKVMDLPLRDVVIGFTQGVFEGIRDGLKEHEQLKKNLVANPPMSNVAPKLRENASVAVPRHINDAIVAYNALSKKSYAVTDSGTRMAIKWTRARYLVDLLHSVEQDLRACNNLYIRFKISNDHFYIAKAANTVEYLQSVRQGIKKALEQIASTVKVEPTTFVRSLHRLVNAHGNVPNTKTIIADGDELVACWCLIVTQVRTGVASQIAIYVSVLEPLRIAISMDRNFTPNTMYSCSSKNPRNILAEYGL